MLGQKENYSTMNFYAGADYGLDPNYGKDQFFGVETSYRVPTGTLGLATDPRTANQLQEISRKLNTGAKTIEFGGISPKVFDAIPDQHLVEIGRLRKLTGSDLTFHGPLVEPTGAKQGWSESDREMAERQMWQSVERAHQVDPKGNLVVTFHSSNGLPDPISIIKDEKTGKEIVKSFLIVDETNGKFTALPVEQNYFKSSDQSLKSVKEQIHIAEESIERQNKEAWFKQLQAVSFHANNGQRAIEGVVSGRGVEDEEARGLLSRDPKLALTLYDQYINGDVSKLIEGTKDENLKRSLQGITNRMVEGDLYLRDAYQELQGLFNQAYGVAKTNNDTETLEKLNAFRNEMKPKLKDIEDPKKLLEFGEEIVKGVNVLRSINPPRTFKPLRDFAVEKSAKTFSNIAYNAYEKFEKKNGSAPIIAIENPPAGDGLTRAEDLRDVVNRSRAMLKNRLIEEQGLKESAADAMAEKLIGVTWDVGHINMIRKFGYSEKDVEKQAEIIADIPGGLKKLHLSDNFGMEHTELPMGMGNVPMAGIMEKFKKYKDNVKKIIETGDWYQLFQVSPFRHSLQAFGSPMYSSKMAPYWNQGAYASGGYFSGYGQMLPDQHFSMYGAGFSNMPPELGGQLGGRSRASGAPLD